jgi:HTH-type transcriptional regulator/antitoxin HigA
MIAKTTKTSRQRPLRDDYLSLIRECPLKAIRSDAEHAAATKVVNRLAVFEEGTLSQGQQDYLDAMTVLLEDYDRRQEPWPRISGLELLKHLMRESKMKVADLGKIVGSTPLASLILSGKRDISKDVMRRLGAHFHLDPGAFL